MPRRDLPPPPAPIAPSAVSPPSQGLAALPAHISRAKSLGDWQVGYEARKAQYARDDAAEAQAQAQQAARDPSLEVQGFHPSGLAGVLDTAGQMLGGAGHGIAQAFDQGVAGARTFGLGVANTLANAPNALPGYSEFHAPVDYNSGANGDTTQQFQDAAQQHGAAISAYPSPAAQFTGHAAEIGTNVGLAIANPVLAGAAGAGSASDAGYSTGGAAAIGGLNALPLLGKPLGGLAGRLLPQVLRSPGVENAIGQGLIGGATPTLINAETQAFESPELAAQTQANLGQDTALSGGMGLGLGALESLLTRGRGAFIAPRPHEVPPSIAAPEPIRPPDIQPDFRSSTVSADPVLTGPDGRPALPQIQRGDFVQTGARPALGPDGLPTGEPGSFVPTGERPTIGPDGLPLINRGELTQTAELPGEGFYKAEATPPTPEGFNRFDATPPTPEGFYRAEPRRDIQPQRSDPTSLGEVPITDPMTEYRRNGVDPRTPTLTGSDLSPVETPPAWELPGKFQRRGELTPENDPYGGNIDQRANADSTTTSTPITEVPPVREDPLHAFDPHQIGDLARKDTSLPETQLQLDPVAQRAEQATDTVAPVRENVRPEYRSDTTQINPPIAPAKPGLRHLSPDAQKFISEVKPGERPLLRDSIDYFKAHPDPAGDTGNLKMVLDMARAKRDRKPGARPKAEAPAEGAAPQPTTSRAEAALVQGGFQRQGEPTPAPIDANAPTERIVKPPAKAAPAQNFHRQGSFDPLAPVEALGKGIHQAVKVAAQPIAGAAKLVGTSAKYLNDRYSQRLWKAVKAMPGGQEAGEKARQALSYTKELQGKFESGAQVALKSVRSGPKARAARASLEEVRWDGDAGFARASEVLDGAIPARPAEEPFRKAMHSLTYRTGLQAERNGYQINVGDKTIGFKADPARQRAPRVLTSALRWYAAHPADADTVALADLIAKANPGLKPADVFAEMATWNERGITKRGMAEDARTIKQFPTHWRNSEGKIVQLLETNPRALVGAVAEKFPQRMAYAKVFGQGAIPKEFASLQAHSADAGKTAGQDLFRALNGMPLEDFGSAFFNRARPGSSLETAQEWASFPWESWKAGKLSAAAIVNSWETLGKARTMGGSNPLKWLKAAKDVSFFNGKEKDSIIEDLAARGAITRDALDWYINKSNYAETATRYVRNTTGAPNHLVNEFNERLSARMNQLWSEALRDGKGGGVDRVRLATLDYTPQQVNDILKGGFSERVHSDIIRRATEWAQGSTSQAAEKSRLGNSPVWRKITIADQFSQMNQNRNLTAWSEAAKEILRPKASFKDQVKSVAAAAFYSADLAGGQVAATALTMLTKAMIVGGGAVLADKVTGSNLGLYDFLWDATKMAYVGSPTQAVADSMDANGTAGEALARPFVPISTLQEASEAFWGKGKYDGMTAVEAMGKFLVSGVALTPIMSNIAAVTGLSQDDKELDASISAFRKWKAKYEPGPKVSGTDDPSGFRSAVRKAGEAMQNGTDPTEALHEALGVRDAAKVAESLRMRKFLKLLKPAQRADAEDYLGHATVSKLAQYDALLEAWAARVHPRR